MSKIIKVTCCEKCPYFSYAYTEDGFFTRHRCDKTRRLINGCVTNIEDVCPLEDENIRGV